MEYNLTWHCITQSNYHVQSNTIVNRSFLLYTNLSNHNFYYYNSSFLCLPVGFGTAFPLMWYLVHHPRLYLSHPCYNCLLLSTNYMVLYIFFLSHSLFLSVQCFHFYALWSAFTISIQLLSGCSLLYCKKVLEKKNFIITTVSATIL